MQLSRVTGAYTDTWAQSPLCDLRLNPSIVPDVSLADWFSIFLIGHPVLRPLRYPDGVRD